jgi:hypothetical protein
VYRYDFEPIVQRSITEFILLAAAPQDFFTKEIEGLANPKVQLSLLKEFCKYVKINKFVIEQVIAEIEAAGYSEYFGGETIRHMLKAVNENPDKLAMPEISLKGLMDQLPAEITDFVSVPKPLVTRPAFLDEPKTESSPVVLTETKGKELPESQPDVESEESFLDIQMESSPSDEVSGIGATEAEAEAIEPISNQIQEEELEIEISTEEVPIEIQEEENQETEPAESPFGKIQEAKPKLAEMPNPKEAATLAGEPIFLNDILKMTEERVTLAETLKTKSVAAPFKTLVPMHYRFTFINSLFAGNQQAWAEAVEKIDQKDNYDAAIEMLKEEYSEKYHWDKEEDNVAILFNYVERKF